MTNAERIAKRAGRKKGVVVLQKNQATKAIMFAENYKCKGNISGSITIHNMNIDKPYREYDVKCDRSSPLGSPFYLCGDETKRPWVCDSYNKWFTREVLSQNNWTAWQELLRLKALYKKHNTLRIFCWCMPKQCHTETIKSWLMKNK